MSENRTAEPLKFAYWVPNVSGGLVTSTIDQRTDWGFDYNRELAVRAERAGCTVRFGLNGFLIARDTEAEARETLREFIAKADQPAVEGAKLAEGVEHLSFLSPLPGQETPVSYLRITVLAACP